MNQPDSSLSRHQHAARLYQSGDLPQAEQVCRALLAEDDRFAPAWHLLGLIAFKSSRHGPAVDCLRRAVAIVPDNGEFQTHFAEACRTTGRLDEAIAAGNRATALLPDSQPAHNNLGLALSEQGRHVEAEACFREAIRLNARYARAHYNLGNTLRAQQRFAEGEGCLREALAIQPDYVQALNALGVVKQQQGDSAEAIELLKTAIRINARYAPCHLNLANSLLSFDDDSGAAQSYKRALQLKPDYFEAWVGIGGVMERLNNFDQAEAAYRRAIEIKPRDVLPRSRLCSVYYALSRFAQVAEEYERILDIQPAYTEALGNYERSRAELCDWTGREAAVERLRRLAADEIAAGRPTPLTPSQAHAFPVTAAEQLALASSASQVILEEAPSHTFRFEDGVNRERLRIGYLSCDFRNHAVSHLCSGMFAVHDRRRFEVFVYSYGPDDGSVYRKQIEDGADRFVDVMPVGDLQAAERIHADEVDILVEMAGHTGNSRLGIAAMRPAPVQAHFLGFPATIGADFIDYFLTDRVCTPPAAERHFVEALVYLPHAYQVNNCDQPIAGRPFTRTECELPERGFVFCSFNNNYKIDPQIFEVWMAILRAVPGSVLWLLESAPQSKANLLREAGKRGVRADRLVFAGRAEKPEHLARHSQADLFLDSTVCNAHTSASDALWAGVPLLTCPGETFTTRVAASLLTSAGLPELIAADLVRYEQIAVRLAAEPEELAALRQRLRDNRLNCPLFDTSRFVRNLEQAYEAMWRKYRAGDPPSAIAIDEVAV